MSHGIPEPHGDCMLLINIPLLWSNDVRWVTNNRKVDSEVGTVFLVARLQNLQYWLISELYAFHVDGTEPSE